MCRRKLNKHKKINQLAGQDIILGQFVYSVNESRNVNKDSGIEELRLELRKMRVTGIYSMLSDDNTLHTDYDCASIVDGDKKHILFKDTQLGVDKFTNIDDAILKAGEIISETCFGKEVGNEEEG